MNAYRQEILGLIEPLLRSTGPSARALDFGSGDGWFASRIAAAGLVGEVVCVDVQQREHVLVQPRLVRSGDALPYAAGAFDLAYAIDVLHHCADPLAALDEMARVARRFLLIKDHTYRTPGGRAALAVMDELGNRRFGIPSTWRYQRGWAWAEHLSARGWTERTRVHPAPCHKRLLGAMTNGLQYVSLFERSGSSR